VTRWVLPAVLAVYAALFASVAAFGWDATWHRLLGQSMTPPFADLRVVTGVTTTLAQGLDPFVSHPGDVWGRAFNYPRIWIRAAAATGITPADTNAVGAIVIACFVAGTALIAPLAVTAGDAALLVVSTTTPAAWMGVARGNVDLIVFLVVCMAIAARRRPWISAAAIGFAGVLKIFPTFAVPALTRRGRAGVAAALVTGALLAAYLVALDGDLALMRAHTDATSKMSYGLPPTAIALGHLVSPGDPGRAAWLTAAGLAAAAIAAGALFAMRVAAEADEAQAYGVCISALIFLGTFWFSSNYDYRLVFLAPALPWMNRMRRSSRATNAAVGWAGLIAYAITTCSAPFYAQAQRAVVSAHTLAALVLLGVFTCALVTERA
jgi:hypothetical protein